MKGNKCVSCTRENFEYIIVRYYFTPFQFNLLEIEDMFYLIGTTVYL